MNTFTSTFRCRPPNDSWCCWPGFGSGGGAAAPLYGTARRGPAAANYMNGQRNLTLARPPMPKSDELLARADGLLELTKRTLASARSDGYGPAVSSELFTELRSSALSFIESSFGREHTYFREFDAKVCDTWEYSSKYGLGILTGMRNEIASGWIVRLRALVASELFSDFLEMSAHLLEQGYKDAAAVLAGGALEEHLRQLAAASGVPIVEEKEGKEVARKANTLNSELRRIDRISLLDNKSVASWLDLRNNAAHGKYDQFTAAQVSNMISGVRDFIARSTG
jgi:hypothetical protein